MSGTSVSDTCGVETAKTARRTHYRWFVLAVVFAVYTLATADRSSMGFAMPFIRKEYGISNTEAGAILSMFFFGYALAQIPAGLIVSKFGVCRVFAPAFTIIAASVGAMSFVPGATALKYAFGALGVAEAPVANGCITTINNWFPARERGLAAGIFISASKFGPLLVPFICAVVVSHTTWHWIFIVFSAPWIVMLLIWLVLVRDNPKWSGFCSPTEVEYIADRTPAEMATKAHRGASDWGLIDRLIRARQVERLDSRARVFASWNVVGTALGYFFLMALISIIMNWLPTYLRDVRHFDVTAMAFGAAAPFAGTVIGNVFGGWLSDRYMDGRRKPLMILTTLSTAVMMWSLTLASGDPLLLTLHLFLVGFMLALGFSNYQALTMGFVTKAVFPVATSITNTGGQLGAASAPLMVGVLLDLSGWNAVFMAMSIAALISLALILTVVEPRDHLA